MIDMVEYIPWMLFACKSWKFQIRHVNLRGVYPPNATPSPPEAKNGLRLRLIKMHDLLYLIHSLPKGPLRLLTLDFWLHLKYQFSIFLTLHNLHVVVLFFEAYPNGIHRHDERLGCLYHLRNPIIFRFHYHSQKVIVSLPIPSMGLVYLPT